MDANRIRTEGFSNENTKRLYESQWPDEPELKKQYEAGNQCGGCSFFAPFNEDWGLCCRDASRHFRETVFEHFTCVSYIHEGWGPHSFSTIAEDHSPSPDMALTRLVRIDTNLIQDWESFHEIFAQALGFPAFYGKNMDAWIDCMRFIDDPAAGMTSIHVPPGGVLILFLDGARDFADRCPEQHRELQECARFVNDSIPDSGKRTLLAIAG